MAVDYEKAKEDLKGCLVDYLVNKGIDINKQFKCLNPAHDDKNPSMSYDRKRNKVHCFSCGEDYDIIDLIKIDYGITDTKEAFKKGYEMFGIGNYTHNKHNTHNKHTDNTHSAVSNPIAPAEKDYTGVIEKCRKQYKKTSYLKDRGISDEVANLFNIGFDDNFYFVSSDKNIAPFNAPAVIIPTSDNSFTARCIDNSKPIRYNKRGHASIFNLKACENQGPVFIVEGEIDALSVIEAGYPATALGSTQNAEKLKTYLAFNKPNCDFYLCLDNDDAGRAAQEKIIEEMERLGLKYYVGNIAGQCKDANEMLLKDKEGFITLLKEVIEAPKPQELTEEERKELELQNYQKNYTLNCVDAFLDDITGRVNTPYIPTGFEKLDKLLDGGLFEGLYFIGAISSLGKTTFTLQIADQIAQQGYDVMIFSLEMSKYELMAKSISRLTLIEAEKANLSVSCAKTTRGITTYSKYFHYSEDEKNLINTAIMRYKDYAGHIVIHEGIGDIGVTRIRELIEAHIRITGKTPVVFIDYLQILAPYNDRATDKQNTDKAVTELKRISRDNKITVFAISSLNRANYSEKISMQAFKESGGIEYSSDVLIGLQFKGQGESGFNIEDAKYSSNDPNRPREIELRVLKNRNGRTGDSIYYDYHSLFNYFNEQ